MKYLNTDLRKAKKAKKDEFYTLLDTIEKELRYYKNLFRNKVVLCNCDDPRESNFVRYFSMNFEHLGLKKLIATHYKEANLFTQEPPYKLEYTGDKNNNRMPDPDEFITKMIGTGDFRSKECIELLEEADIVVTNPPFSLFREYLAQLMKYNKKFLIIGNINAITYKECFKHIKDNKMWLGASIHSGDREFRVPEDYPLNAAGCRVDDNGNKYIRVKGVRWLTNLDYQERYGDLVLYKKYTPDRYPKYDNYNAINVDKTTEIPIDYEGVLGVPITFLDKYNPEQFEILGITDRQNTSGLRTKKYTASDSPRFNDLNARSVLKIGKTYKAVYARLLIKNKKVKK